MCSGIVVPLRGIGLLPGGYGINSLCSKILWDEEDSTLVSCPENEASSSVKLAIVYLVTPNRCLWFSLRVCHTPQGNIWQCLEAFLVVTSRGGAIGIQ